MQNVVVGLNWQYNLEILYVMSENKFIVLKDLYEGWNQVELSPP